MKVNLVKPIVDDLSVTFSRVVENVIHLEDIRNFLRNKFEIIGEEYVSKEFDLIYNKYMSYKHGFEYIKENDLVKFLFFYKFDNEEWAKIILRIIHDGNFWFGDNVIKIIANLAH